MSSEASAREMPDTDLFISRGKVEPHTGDV